MHPQFRATIIIVIALIAISAGYLLYGYWTKQPEPVTNTSGNDVLAEEVSQIENFEREVADYDDEAAIISQLDFTVQDVSNDTPTEPVTLETLSEDGQELDAIATSADQQQEDQTAVDQTFNDFSGITN